MDFVVFGDSAYFTSKPYRLPFLVNTRSSSALPWAPQKYACHSPARARICSITNPSNDAPTFGLSAISSAVERSSIACSIPVSRTYTFGDRTCLFFTLRNQGGRTRTTKAPASKSK